MRIDGRRTSLVLTIFCSLVAALAGPNLASDLVITGAVDGPLTGGVPKAVELYALNNIADLSIYGLGSANNGGGTDGQEFTFPAVGASAGQFIYVASEASGFTTFFGFAPDYTSGALAINGDDAIELFQNGFVVDVFGDINVDGSGQPWDHLDGWAYRGDNTGPDCSTFVLTNWSFSGINVLDGETSNGTAATPFPIGTFSTTRTDSAPCVQTTSPADGDVGVSLDANVVVNFDEDVLPSGSWFSISCTTSGAHTAGVTGGFQSFTLDPDVDFDGGETCTVTLVAAEVADSDADDPPDNLVADFVFTFDTLSVGPVDWVINEIHADPASGSAGDANGDGIRDFSDDEFVEIVNTSGSDMDISGWTLSDGFTVRHTFPASSVVPDGCSIVVFGGGTPTGVFGNSLVQTASTGSVGLNNSGDDVSLNDGSSDVAMASYGSDGGDNQSLTLSPDISGALPYIRHTLATGAGGTRFSPGTRADGVAFSGCAPVSGGWVINELHADPASGAAGDANGDGTRNSSQDEFVELINNSGSSREISGWTLSDGAGLRHTFPSGTFVADGCGVLVFGGGTPTGTFGRMPVQTASVGFLGLNNTGDDLTLDSGIGTVTTASYGGEGGDNQSLTLDPDVTGTAFVKHTLATGSGGTLYSPGTRIDGEQFEGCPQEREIFEIQGSSLASPFAGQSVVTLDNPVTCLATDGFFIQTPFDRDDNDVDTSNGIFVFTGGAPTVAVGDIVEVSGTVQEFFGFTEIGNANVVVTGNDPGQVPPAVVFSATVPSPDPLAPSCGIEYECYEGMLVDVPAGIVAASNQEFGSDPFAEIHVTAGPARPFREPGVEFPGLGLPPIPTWDGNPEVFELDPDKLGLPTLNIPARSTFSARGVIGFEFNHYELWPNELTVVPAALPVPVRPREPFETTVGSLNLFRLFAGDTLALSKLSPYIIDVLRAPDILAVQEVENIAVLEALAAQILADSGGAVDYTAHLVEGNDIGGIDVGFLTRTGITNITITQLGAAETFVNPITLENDILHDRPPLLLEATCDGTFPIAVMALHMRSLGGIDGSEGERVRVKRLEQALSVAQKVQDIQTTDPDVYLVVTGDFNAFEFTDGYVDVAGLIKGDTDPAMSLLSGLDLVDPDLANQVLSLPAEERYSFIFRDSFNPAGSRGDAQVLDHAMTSEALGNLITGFEYGRGNADAAEELVEDDGTLDDIRLRASDHDGLVLYIFKDEDQDGVPDAEDVCLGTEIPETVPTSGALGPNRWALTDDEDPLVFDQAPPQGGSQASYTLGDTAGCSCEQIIDALELGAGQAKFGCSSSNMLTWVNLVNP